MANARQKARQEAEAEYRQKYGKYDQFEQDPWSAVQSWLNQASQHSIWGSKVNEWVQSQIKAQDPGQEPQPDIPVLDYQGQPTGKATYSAEQLRKWHQWNQTQANRQYDQRYGQLDQRIQGFERAQQEAQAFQAAQREIAQMAAEYPYFDELRPEIHQALLDHPEWDANIDRAYNYVFRTKKLPTISAAEQQKVLDSFNQKSAGTTVPASGTAPGLPNFKKMSFGEVAEYMAANPDVAKEFMNKRRG